MMSMIVMSIMYVRSGTITLSLTVFILQDDCEFLDVWTVENGIL